jgi:hypothetical protein
MGPADEVPPHEQFFLKGLTAEQEGAPRTVRTELHVATAGLEDEQRPSRYGAVVDGEPFGQGEHRMLETRLEREPRA